MNSRNPYRFNRPVDSGFGALIAIVLTFLVFGIVALVGWVRNIIWLLAFTGDPTGEFWISIVGIILYPIGAAMGYLH